MTGEKRWEIRTFKAKEMSSAQFISMLCISDMTSIVGRTEDFDVIARAFMYQYEDVCCLPYLYIKGGSGGSLGSLRV